MLRPTDGGERFELASPTAMPNAAGFLWNRKMMIQATSRGYAVAQFMQPEPAKYAHAPNLQAKSFMQPEQAYYAHHPGRFVYIRDDESGQLFSAPHEPVRQQPDSFTFSVGKSDLLWRVEHLGLRVELRLGLPTDDVVELWTLTVTNLSGRPRHISVTPYFPIGYMSWMNQSGEYRPDLGGIVASCVTPYQKVEDHFKQKDFKDKTYFLCEDAPDSWEVNQAAFEGEGGLHNPAGLQHDSLAGGDARYETPAAVVQYKLPLAPSQVVQKRFLFGPAFDDAEIARMRTRYLSAESFARTATEYAQYIAGGSGCLRIHTPDKELDNFVNHWLPRQVFYHGDVNRLTTDPQTRNYLQDNMGMSFVKPSVMRAAFLHALGQQENTGAMPDGILLVDGAELKYINQVPHTDHCVWLPIALEAYLDETADWTLLDEVVTDVSGRRETVATRMGRAMDWLLKERDARGLSFIAQGDWCDPMNMVGYKGRGVSGWLTVAAAYALNLWAGMCEQSGAQEQATHFRAGAASMNAAANEHLWDGRWYARGITDDNVKFGVKQDVEGRIFLNPQAWAMLSGAASGEQRRCMLNEVEQQLHSPYGVSMFAPPYSKMRDDVGRVTQKHPGSAENGAVYNHAAIFYIYSLYTVGETERAYQLLRQMIPGPDEADYLQRGQMPVFIPNYYRGAHREYPRTAGRSSQLFNTGTVSWAYRCLVEGLCGLKGDRNGLLVQPNMPAAWNSMQVERSFRGAHFTLNIKRAEVGAIQVWRDGQQLAQARIDTFAAGDHIQLEVLLPL
ncbi:GH36-type glycosyl hydrolase domain-containing protein [Massilia sp. CF038]|uniref:GH36-type glycosyl hydrolase domain-containing protein n=1 Tax=Massilia sp. CF038 TaxID=1881045 RepID=UPI0009134BBA|nr:NdvB protein [Massilia sp. CF038]SHG38502.1 cellobionic acid phosphorylase [Massilia sp. CF038]